MATATVYTISLVTDEIVDQFDCDWNYAIGEYHGKRNPRGRYYIARKGSKVPYPKKTKPLKNVKALSELVERQDHFFGDQADTQEHSQ